MVRNSSDQKVSAAWVVISVGVFVVVFLAAFYSQPLVADLRRYDLWLMILDDVLEAGTAADASATPAGIQFLAQRIPHFAGAAALLVLAACHGAVVCSLFLRGIQLSFAERAVIGMGSGLAVLSLVTLGCGLLGQLNLWAISLPSIASAIAAWSGRRRAAVSFQPERLRSQSDTSPVSALVAPLALMIIVPFTAFLLLGANSPPTDFDVREYHLQGPKEWFQQGQISFLRHNVYTSFPFLSEMLSLAGMVIQQDWWHGALTGQIVIACFQILSMLAVFAVARRWIHSNVAWIAALLYLTVPWTLRISLIAYAEGALTFFLTATVMTGLLAMKTETCRRQLLFVGGLMAGAAMASKYTGLIIVIFPVAVWFLAETWNGTHDRIPRLMTTVVCFGTGIVLMVGPWLLRNLWDTGNPVYPLAYSIFGGSEWSDDLNARWKTAHGPPEHLPALIPRHFLDASLRNTWTSGILFALAIPSVIVGRRNRTLAIVLAVSAWGFFSWWAFTHRIDRFWIPVLPLLSIAAASLWILSPSRAWRGFLLTAILLTTLANVRFCRIPALEGFHAGLMDLNAARELTVRADIRYLNRTITDNERVLMVGDAEVFDCTFPLVYNTVFDDCLFEEWTSHPEDADLPADARRFLPSAELHKSLQSRGITHLCVHWGEVLRYRLPGSYGYTEYLQPTRFTQLVRSGVLRPPITLLARPWTSLSAAESEVVSSWDGFEDLFPDTDSLAIVQLFEVTPLDSAKSEASSGMAVESLP